MTWDDGVVMVGMALLGAATAWQVYGSMQRRRRLRRYGGALRAPRSLNDPMVLGPAVLIITGSALLLVPLLHRSLA